MLYQLSYASHHNLTILANRQQNCKGEITPPFFPPPFALPAPHQKNGGKFTFFPFFSLNLVQKIPLSLPLGNPRRKKPCLPPRPRRACRTEPKCPSPHGTLLRR